MFGGLSDGAGVRSRWDSVVQDPDPVPRTVIGRRRCALCGRVTPTTAWVRGSYWRWGYDACDACLEDRERANLLAGVGCAALGLLPVTMLTLIVIWAVVSTVMNTR